MAEHRNAVPGQWKSLRELKTGKRAETQALHGSAPLQASDLADGLSRRRFMTLLGASAALAAGGCARSVDRGKVVPYTNRPEEVTPGKANYYASAWSEGAQVYSVLVKTREGRPIHLEGNDEHPAYGGKTSLRTHAEILNLYDPDRLQGARAGERELPQEQAVDALRQSLNGRVLLLTGADLSPAREALFERLRSQVPGLERRQWEALDNSSEVLGSAELFGERHQWRFELNKAEVVLSLDADFLGEYANGTSQARQWSKGRLVADRKAQMSRCYVAESTMTVTGSKADQRLRLPASGQAELAYALAAGLRGRGVPLPAGVDGGLLAEFRLDAVARKYHLDMAVLEALLQDLAHAGKNAAVLAGQQTGSTCHAAVVLLNTMLGSVGHCLHLEPVGSRQTLDAEGRRATIREMASGQWDTVILFGVNPVFDTPAAWGFADAFAKVGRRVSLCLRADESAEACTLVIPVSHWLEAWGEYMTPDGMRCLQQPVIEALHGTLQGEDLLLRATGLEGNYLDHIRDFWANQVQPAGSPVPFDRFWHTVLHDGIYRSPALAARGNRLNGDAVAARMRELDKLTDKGHTGAEVLVLPSPALYDGRCANVGWLQECPDPVHKMTWGNALLLSPAEAEKLHAETGAIVRLSLGSKSWDLPVLVAPGQADHVAVVHAGGGRTTGSVCNGVGFNAFELADRPETATMELVEKAREDVVLQTQEHHNLEGRDHVRLFSIEDYAKHKEKHYHVDPYLKKGYDFYPEREFPGNRWGMVLDLAACTGCTACVLACQSENNIPVVGPERVAKGREMHWIRLDRYYEGSADEPMVLQQPMLCQQCDNAPCENVCPVAATSQSEDGLNTMTYNRCVGTRYCANNCPYKVRRFNYFTYTDKRQPLDLAANPEVTIRDRGVMEKCTFCIQRVNSARAQAKAEGREIRDGEVRTACQNACPTDAIVFGDRNDTSSQVARAWENERSYRVLEELGAKPAIHYLADMRNPAVAQASESGDHDEHH